MKRLICRIFGHDWDWPTMVLERIAGGIMIHPHMRVCQRCDAYEVDHKRNSTLTWLKPDHSLGLKVNKEMGWTHEE